MAVHGDGAKKFHHREQQAISITKPFHIRTVRWSSSGDEGHLRSRGNDSGAVSAQEVRSIISSRDKVKSSVFSEGKVRSSVSLGCKKRISISSRGKEQCLLRRAPRTGRTPPGGAFAPVEQVQEGPSPAFVKESINGLAELDQRTLRGVLRQMMLEDIPPMDPLGQGAEVGLGLLENTERVSQRKRGSLSLIGRVAYASMVQDVSPNPEWLGLQALLDRFKAESAHIKGVPLVLRISAFMHGHGHPELAKKLNDKIPMTVDEMWERVRAFIRGETTANTTEVIRSPYWEKSASKTVDAMIEGFKVRRIYVDGGRMGMRSLGAVASTLHSMIKFPTSNRIATLATAKETMRECRKIEKAQSLSWPRKEPMQLDDMKVKQQLDKGRKSPQAVVFAWTLADMTGIPRAITEQFLDTYPHIEPKAGIVKRVRYPSWVSNLVLVKKVEESWRMCINFKDLNKACPKDLYPLPEIDWKIKSLMGFKVFCYTKTPFGLKNVGATYQRLVDSAFKEQIWVNLEAYVDDMVIKFQAEQYIIRDVEQTFSTLRKINMKLNLKKCSFGVEEGKFLGYVVTSEGIRANPEKTKAVMGMPSPRTLKRLQSLSGKLWTEVSEAMFLEMKNLVSEFLTLTTSKKGETLMMYLAAADEAISAVFFTERDGRKMPIHYVSRSLQGAETNYALMEKLTLALVHAARRLRRVHSIQYVPRVAVKGQVLANFLADTLTKVNATLVVANTPRVEDIPESLNARKNLTPGPRAWRLYTDGASNSGGSGAGLILIAPNDMEYSYALCLNFSNSNNDAEYEALLAGLRVAIEIAKNRKADALSKLTTVQFDHLSKEVLVEVLNERSVKTQKVNMEVEEEGPTWMTSIRNYLEKGMLPKDLVDARTLMEKIRNYMLENEVLYGYYQPFMHRDARELIRACDDCQAHASVPKLPKADMISGNGAVERENRSLLKGIKTRLEKGGSVWVKEVPNVLWAHRTMKKTNNGETPFSLTYGTEAVIPAEIGMLTHQTSKVNKKTNQKLRLNLDMLEERRELAAIREARYKQQVKKYYNKKVGHVQFKVGEFVLRKNEASRAANTGKLGPTWEGPYKVIQAFQSGAYKLSNIEGEEVPRTWHAFNIQKCYM
nr:hypothetical protein [Tanacetum cinerariifolium]